MPRQQHLHVAATRLACPRPADEPAPAASQPPFRADPEAFAQFVASRAEAMRYVAADLCCSGYPYAHQGRGAEGFDDLGLVRACVQAAVDWQAQALGAGQPDPIADFADYAPSSWQFDPASIGRVVEDWGLVRAGGAGGNVSKEARSGDLIVYMGRGVRMGIVMAPWRDPGRWPHFESPAVARVWEGQPPAVARESRMSWGPLALYRWPEVSR